MNIFFKSFIIVITFASIKVNSQTIFNSEVTVGRTSPAHSYFPKMKMNKTFSFSVGKKHDKNLAWVKELNNPETGLTFEYSDYGNNEFVGKSFAILPYWEIPLFKNKSNKFSLNTAMGVSYLTNNYNNGENWQNKAISTKFTWSYRLFFYYNLFKNSRVDTRATLGYSHHSNGHVKWPNIGLNTFLVGLNFKFNNPSITETFEKDKTLKPLRFYSYKLGIGQQSLSRLNNTNKEVYSTGFSMGKIYRNTYKVGLGFYYRFYENYYDYIKNEGILVNEDYPNLKKNVVYNSSSYGVFINGEILMNHVGIETEIGINIDKPFYKIDYRIGKEKYNPATNQLEISEINNYFWIKRFVSGKMGLKYYLLNTKNTPKHNFFVGAYIVSNLSQADYSELSVGYTHIIK